MKNVIKTTGTIAIAAIVMLTLIACGQPRLKGKVTIDGDPHIGATLTANIAALGGSGIITYQWLRDGATAISTDVTYTVQLADRDASITVTVVRSDNSGSVTSAPVTNRGHVGSTGPGGGIIFYHDPAGFTMSDTGETAFWLEAAPANMETSLRWSTTTNWQNAPHVAGASNAIGAGRKNTTLILAVDATAPAALACRNFSNNGKDDWFLPSRNELNALYRSRAVVDNLGTSWFWSSSQYDSFRAWNQDFDGGRQFGYEYYSSSVRPVRAF
ncbi:MAG: DUF1566 domain-containing protein [Treponema sp.]|nr:DUF1566 domain-containing protein [Treponema sp.]